MFKEKRKRTKRKIRKKRKKEKGKKTKGVLLGRIKMMKIER